MFYAAHNIYADINKGNKGFRNTWVISRFNKKSERDEFIKKYENKKAHAASRKAAELIWRYNYLSMGKKIPSGGLFNLDEYGISNFWNEQGLNGD